MAPVRRSLYRAGVASALLSQITNVAATPISDRGQGLDLGLGLNLDPILDPILGLLGGILDFCEAPLVLEVIPYLTVTLTIVESAGLHVIGLDSPETVKFDKPTTVTVTETATKTTSILCSTETTITSTWSSNGGKPTTATCRWSPNPPADCIGSGRPTFTTTSPCKTSTTTTTASSCTPSTTTTTTTTAIPTTTTTTSTTTSATASSCPAPSAPTLSCDQYGYLIQAATLYRADLSTGINTQVKKTVGDGTNANSIAYNVLDNYLYAYQQGKNSLLRISSDGSSEVVIQGIPAGNLGDIDLNGRYWISSGGTKWWVLDLYPGSATYGQVLNSGTADTLGVTVADWVYLPNEGQYLYSVGQNSTTKAASMIRFSLTTFQWEKVANYPSVTRSGFGALYGMNNGTLYGSDNTSGEIWQFPISGTPFKITTGPKSGDNDGARCVLNLL
ncbi:hypothetical protein F5884DRAFT_881405 [Xylogone sp. PMI_703]|nr:hypothetical protein F5884DRAFT_881405 [Xylogone sp. PMI_703]